MKKYSIGIDLGGTKILAGIVNTETGEVIAHAKKRTKVQSRKGSDILIKRVIKTIEAALAESNVSIDEIEKIGIGLPGQVDRENGILISAPNLYTYDLDFRTILGDHFGLPVKVGNDVDVATIGEHKFGAGVGYDSAVCVFVGTGVGAGIIQNGQIWIGATGTAGEIGHIVVDSGGRPCACGASGCLEAYASRTAIEKKILASLKKGQKSCIEVSEDGVIRSKSIKDAVENNDELVINALDDAAEYLSCGLASVVNFLNPAVIILGGGLIEAVDYFYDLTVKKTKAKALPVPARDLNIIKTKLGDFSGIIGAASL
jgi:glucokinase